MINISLNGQKTSFDQKINLDELLHQLKMSPQNVAIAKNLEVIPHSELSKFYIEDGDEIEIFHAVGGG